MRMRYKNFEFPSNPSEIEILSSSACSSKSEIQGGSIVENVSVNPTVVSGSGEFYGEGSEEYCARLQNMLRDRESGWLFAPSAPPIKAFFTEFKFGRNNKKNSVSYTFCFTEDCTNKKAYIPPESITACEGDNAFEIANRFGVSVNDIMRLNDFKTPFDINKGDRVVLYEN